jgi:hypothetical protein
MEFLLPVLWFAGSILIFELLYRPIKIYTPLQLQEADNLLYFSYMEKHETVSDALYIIHKIYVGNKKQLQIIDFYR